MKMLVVIKSNIKKIFSSQSLLNVLIGTFVVLFIIVVYLSLVIYFDNKPTFSCTSKGITTFFELYKYPIALFAALLAIVTLAVTTRRSIVADKQIIEMITQRKASYLPDVIIARSIFYIKTGVGTENRPFIKFNVGKSGLPPKIKLHNIGRGVAKNFEYEFIYNVRECFNVMKQFYADKYFTFKIEGDIAELKTNSEFGPIFSSIHIKDIQTQKHIDFILTADTSDGPIEIILPNDYLILNFLKDEISHQNVINKEAKIISIDDMFPKLEFKCNYQDIGQRPLTKKFELHISPEVHSRLLNADNQFNSCEYKYEVVAKDVTNKPSGNI